MRSFLATMMILLAASAAAEDLVVTRAVVPVVGSVDGANGVRWKTDVELHNDQRTEVTVALTLPTAPGQPAIVTSIAPNDSIRFPDVVAEAFGMDLALSPLVIETSGRRSVGVRATVYGLKGADPTPAQAIPVSYGATFFPIRVLQDLSFSDAYRTNIGLANLGDRAAEFTMALQRVSGRNVAVTRVAIPPNSIWHMAIQSAFPLITNGDHFSVVLETASPDTYVYGSVIENATNAAHFVEPTVGTEPE